MKRELVPVLITILISILYLVVARPYNLGITSDSVSYVEVAQNISDGKGIVNDDNEIDNHWPPGYPIILGIVSKIANKGVLEVGIYLNIIMFLLVGFLFIYIMRELNLNKAIVIAVCWIYLLAKPTSAYLMFWSEVVFMLLFLLTILFFFKWLNNSSSKYLLIAGLLSGCFFLTRYAGLGLIIGFSLFITFSRGSIVTKIKNVLLYVFPIALLFFAWTLYSNSLNQKSIDREIVLHIINLDQIKLGIITIATWFTFDRIITPSIFAIITVVLLYHIKKNYPVNSAYYSRYRQYFILLLLLIVSYLGFLVLSISLMDIATQLNSRMLYPIYPIGLLIMGIVLNPFFLENRLNKSVLAFVIMLSIFIPISSVPIWTKHYSLGHGYASEEFRNSETLESVSHVGDLIIYTNGFDVLRLYGISDSQSLPQKADPYSGQPNSLYHTEIQLLKEELLMGNAQIVHFDKVLKGSLMPPDEVLSEFKDFDVQILEDGFSIRPPSLRNK